ncbi:MAG TPA: transglycosylase SLT domain-containing protein [Thermoanaerobaculia bacterium]|nr:transglycosylase SLT domain-containing protein [Thermoanaerobaculia bacterium]
MMPNPRFPRFLPVLPLLIIIGCSGSKPAPAVAPSPPPPPSVSTLEEARALRAAGKSGEYLDALLHLSRSSDPFLAARATARLGLAQLEAQRWQEAAMTLSAAAEKTPGIAPFLLLRAAEAELRSGKASDAAATLSRLTMIAPTSTAAAIARVRLPAAFAAASDRAGTDASFEQAFSIGIDELTEEEFAALADGLDAAGRGDLATRMRMRLLADYPQGRLTEETYGKLAAHAASLLDGLPLKDAVDLAAKLARSDRYDQVLDLLERASRMHPAAAEDPQYRAVRLRALFSSRNYERLLAEVAPESLSDPALRLLRARAAWRAERPAEFLEGLAAIERDFPTSREAAEAKVQRARYYMADGGRLDLAAENLRDALAAGATGNDGENLWTLGWVYTLAKRDDEALETLRRYLERFPDADYTSNALFWSGKIHGRNGRMAERDASFAQLTAQYPYSYFSYRAREILTEAGRAANSTMSRANPFPNVETLPSDARLQAVDELMEAGLERDAAREMKRIAADYPEDLAVAFKLADVYARGGEPFRANGVLQRRFREFVRHGGDGIPRRFWEILFPLQYWPILQQEAGRHGLDPFLLASIVRQESGFEPRTVSNAGAVGLMQLMPEEAPDIARRAGLGEVTRDSLFDARVNIALGAAEYAQKLESLGGNHTLAIAAYNAGEKAVGRWLARTPVDDLDVFIESIPYAETRLYVKTVTRNRFEYRRIYESSIAVPQRPAS